MATHWYRVDFQDGTRARSLCGSSELAPNELLEALATEPFIRLDDLFYRDNRNRYLPWSDWDPRLQSTAWIHGKFISVIMPFAGDPRECVA